MLSIGEFSNICQVSTKTLRYYAEIGLILPIEINPENGYRYYSINQLETMLLINRLKSYHFSLEEIKKIIELDETQDEEFYLMLNQKKNELNQQLHSYERTLNQLNQDLSHIKQGKKVMSYLDDIDVKLTEVSPMSILYMRKFIQQHEYPQEYEQCYGQLLKRIASEKLTMIAPPMVLFHSNEFCPFGLDTEFAIAIKEKVTGSRQFNPGLCLKTTLRGSYSQLSSVYAKQREWTEKEGYVSSDAVFEVYITDPSEVSSENDLITEIYYPVKKRRTYESR